MRSWNAYQTGETSVNFHSSGYGWIIKSVDTPPPKKRLVTAEVPYRDGLMDFSALYGDQPYEDRTVTVTFQQEVREDSHGEENPAVELERLLLRGGSIWDRYVDSLDPNWYWYGKPASVSHTVKNHIYTVTAVYTMEPFRRRITDSSAILWDSFCFLTDTLSPRGITVPVGEWTKVTLSNPGPVPVAIDVETDQWLVLLMPYDDGSDLTGKTVTEGKSMGRYVIYKGDSSVYDEFLTVATVKPGSHPVWLWVSTSATAAANVTLSITEVSL